MTQNTLSAAILPSKQHSFLSLTAQLLF